MTHLFSQISDKYKDLRYKFFDSPPIGKKVVYLPDENSFNYAYHDGAYERFQFAPADIMTVKSIEKAERYNHIHVEENTCVFTPAELVPLESVNLMDIKKIKDYMRNQWSYPHVVRKINKFFRGEK